MSAASTTPTTLPKNFGLYVLGAGFSVAAGMPLANDLWKEVRHRAEKMEGRAEKFRRDLEYYCRFKNECEGKAISAEQVNFEEFLGFLDIEFHLGLLGSDTWSVHGNETQVMVKTLIGQILAEQMPKEIPAVYVEFAKKLRPGDFVLTFNYDLLLERALENAEVPYRLFPTRYKSANSAIVDSERGEVVILKLHGSIDWFDRGRYRRAEENFRQQNATGSPSNPIFNPESDVRTIPLLDGPRHDSDAMNEVYRVLDVERVYKKQLMFLETPILVPPSATKVLWFEKFKDFWWGMGDAGSLNRRLTIIGFSLADHDQYAKQVLYSIIRNYQEVEWDAEMLGKKKTPLYLVDMRKDDSDKDALRARYAFVDWSKARIEFDGFSQKVVSEL